MKWGISVAVAIVLALFTMAKYNTFVGLEEKVNQTYSQVQNVMQRLKLFWVIIPRMVNC